MINKFLKGYSLYVVVLILSAYIIYMGITLKKLSYRDGYWRGWDAAVLDSMEKGLRK